MLNEKLKTHYRKNTGRWEDSRIFQKSTELCGTPKAIADEIEIRLNDGQEVVVIEVGAMWAGDSIDIAVKLKKQIEEGRLIFILTDKEQFDPSVGIRKGFKRNNAARRLCIQPELPDEETLAYLRENSRYTRRIADVEIQKLPQVLKREGVGAVDILIEHYGGLFHAENQRGAVKAVEESLKPGGIVFTAEYLEDEVKYGDITKGDLIPENQHSWAQIRKTYRKPK